MSLGTVLLVVNVSTLNIALPVVVRHFEAGAAAASWLLLAFMLAQTGLLMVFGRLADVLGRRGTYLGGLAVFTLASLLAGLAPSVEVLIAMRVLQGVGGAVLLANGTAVIAWAFGPARLSQGMGVYLGVLGAAPLLGPSIGGYLAETAGWQWVFWFNVPLGLLALAWGSFSLPAVPRGPREPIDVLGAVLLIGWLGGLVVAFSEAGAGAWTGPLAIGGAAACVLLLPFFALRQLRSRYPLVDLALFADRGFTLGSVAALFNTLARFGTLLLLALFLQAVSGMTPAQAGLAVLPGPLAGMVAAPAGGFLGRRVAPRTLAVAGSATACAGLALMLPLLAADTPYWLVALCLVLVSAGGGLFATGNTSAILARVPAERLGIANGLRMTLQNVGNVMSAALCLALAASALARTERHLLYEGAAGALSRASLGDLVDGYRRAFALLLAASVIATLTSLANRRTRERHEETAGAPVPVPPEEGPERLPERKSHARR
ncbi:DHA2 family efflux MFS transporter permease subunit [Spirillospora sp. NPDC029432]|uniref:DHA2 family efflux MFS transporter permease subunit n=1 Tax=Spirillospora sp. NPDC029432 TaxID=3154599 RepID=UPI003454C345